MKPRENLKHDGEPGNAGATTGSGFHRQSLAMLGITILGILYPRRRDATCKVEERFPPTVGRLRGVRDGELLRKTKPKDQCQPLRSRSEVMWAT